MNQETSIKMSIQEFNQMLVEDGSDITIVDYIKEINDRFYNIDIDFIDDFIELVDKDECCISHKMLVKYGVLSFTGGSHDIKTILVKNNLIENIDYLIRINSDRKLNPKSEISYLLHPKAFKKILIRSRNTDKFADYYLLLEEAIKHYNDFQILQLKEKIQRINHNKILELENSDTLDHFVIVKSNNYKEFPYATIKGSQKNLNETMNEYDITEDNVILHLRVPSQQNFLKKVKEVMKAKFNENAFLVRQKKYKDRTTNDVYYNEDELDDERQYITSVTRWFNIVGISEEKFIRTVKQIHKSRFN